MCIKKTALIYFLISSTVLLTARAQENAGSDARKVVETLFLAMEKGDSTMARSTFAKQVTTATIYKDKTGKVVLRQEDGIDGFVKAIGTPHEGTWYEEIWNTKVDVDGDFAQLWCEYAFYVDKKFSHCGADAVHLVKESGGWKIFHLADTRRIAGCNVPKEIQDRHK